MNEEKLMREKNSKCFVEEINGTNDVNESDLNKEMEILNPEENKFENLKTYKSRFWILLLFSLISWYQVSFLLCFLI